MSQTRSLQDRFHAGDRAALARVLSYIEDYPDLSGSWIAALPPVSQSQVIGITGPPGAGKSTLVDALIRAYRKAGRTVGVLAFDPSSRESGGAALGDRVRMNETWSDEGVFIRSLANRGRLGGLSDAVFGALRAYDAFGIDIVLVETVGVGQGEIDVGDVADLTILVQVPGTGDTIQLLKAGVLEIADIIVVNKADLPGATTLLRDLKSLVTQVDPGRSGTPIVSTAAISAEGVATLIEEVERLLPSTTLSGTARAAAEIRHYVMSEVERQVEDWLQSEAGAGIVADVCRGELSAWDARRLLIGELRPR